MAEFKLAPLCIGAHTDGGLQIQLPQANGDFVEWDRSYYEVALEIFGETFIN